MISPLQSILSRQTNHSFPLSFFSICISIGEKCRRRNKNRRGICICFWKRGGCHFNKL